MSKTEYTEPANIFPRATEHIPEMIAIIQGLLEKGIAYEVNGNIYFDIKRFPGYGKLSGNQLENMLAGVREGVMKIGITRRIFRCGRWQNPDAKWRGKVPGGVVFLVGISNAAPCR